MSFLNVQVRHFLDTALYIHITAFGFPVWEDAVIIQDHNKKGTTEELQSTYLEQEEQ